MKITPREILTRVFTHPKTLDLIVQSKDYTSRTNNECGFIVYYNPCILPYIPLLGKEFVDHSRLIEGDSNSVSFNTTKERSHYYAKPVLKLHTHPREDDPLL